MRRSSRHLPALVLFCASLLFAACSRSSETSSDTSAAPSTATSASSASTSSHGTPEDVAFAFFEAARANDKAGIEALFTDKARASMSSDSSFDIHSATVGAFDVGSATIQGNEAQVPVTAEMDDQEQDMRLLMRRESGAWQLYGFDVSIGGEGWMTFNLESIEELLEGFTAGMASEMAGAMEDAFSDWSQGGSEEEIALERERFETLSGISAQEHRAFWQVDLDVNEEPALDVLQELVAGTGLSIDTGDQTDAFTEVITLRAARVSRAEAIERVCNEIGFHPVWPEPDLSGAFGTVAQSMADGMVDVVESALGDTVDDLTLETIEADGPQLGFAVGPRRYPVAFAGPFVIEVQELEEAVPTTTGALTLAVRSLGLAPACLAYQTEMVELCSVDSIEGPSGQNLNADDGVTFLGTPNVSGGYLLDTTHLDLKGLLRDVESISSVRGSISLTIPTSVTEARCASGSTDTIEADGFSVTPKEWNTYSTLDVTCETGTENVRVRMSPLFEDGRPMGMLMSDSMPWDDLVRASLQTPETPAQIDLKICTVETMSYDFELRDVPLERFAEMPAALAALEFNGPEPFAVEFVRFTKRDADFPEVELTIKNLSNKDATSVLAEFHYVDASGNDLENFQHTLSGPFGMDGVEPFRARSEQTERTTAFFMPEATQSVRVVVTQVEFVDASTWSRPD